MIFYKWMIKPELVSGEEGVVEVSLINLRRELTEPMYFTADAALLLGTILCQASQEARVHGKNRDKARS